MDVLQKKKELEEELSAATPKTSKISELTEVLSKAYKAEELFRRQQSRILWLQGGDGNSAFFTL